MRRDEASEIEAMARVGVGMIAAAFAIAACAADREREASEPIGALRIEIDEALAPQVFEIEGSARVASPDEAPGLWAAAPGLPRPERGRVLNVTTGESVTVALFRASGNGIRVSGVVAEAIGMDSGDRVRLTAVRSEPRVLAFDRR